MWMRDGVSSPARFARKQACPRLGPIPPARPLAHPPTHPLLRCSGGAPTCSCTSPSGSRSSSAPLSSPPRCSLRGSLAATHAYFIRRLICGTSGEDVVGGGSSKRRWQSWGR